MVSSGQNHDEKQFLEETSCTYRNLHSTISKWSVDSYMEIYKAHMDKPPKSGVKGLELGCSNGYSTKCLAEIIDELHVIDGSRKMLEQASHVAKAGNINYHYGLFEEITELEKYDYIFCSYVLEHVLNPEEILKVCYKALKRKGKIFITVPNAKALSRQMALEMGLIASVYDLTENDLAHGHRRTFDLESLKLLAESTPCSVESIGGTFVKPFADFQMNKMIESGIIGKEQLLGMQGMAKKYPDISGSIYAVLKK